MASSVFNCLTQTRLKKRKRTSFLMAVPARINGGEEDEEVEGLFEEGGFVEADSEVPPHLRALADAVHRGDVAALRVALDNHTGSIDDPIEEGDTLLHLCCLYGHLSCVQLLVSSGASIETKDEDGAIPLHDACAGGYIDIVQFLINAAGNDEVVKRMLQTVDSEGDTPLHHAARGEYLDVVNFLISIGASPTTRNAYGKTPADLVESDLAVQSVLEAAARS